MIYGMKDSYIQTLQGQYVYAGRTQILNNPRYYVSSLKINEVDLYICIPLHSNGKYFVKIEKPRSTSYSNHWKNHGLNLEKCLILTKEEFDNYNDGYVAVENNVVNDIKNKKDNIETECLKYLENYLMIYEKNKNGMLLSNEEKNILNYSSLNLYKEKIDYLLSQDELELNLVDMSNE